MTAITPLTIFLNYLLGLCSGVNNSSFFLNLFSVDGPPEYRLGFIGAPMATVLCYNAVALLTILGLAFHLRSWPINTEQVVNTSESPRFFDGVPTLLKAGAAGVGEVSIT